MATTRWIIVGAGSAGCVVANRLSARPDADVVVLEDGPDLAPDAVPAAIAGPSFFDAMAAPGRMYPDLHATMTTGGEPRLYRRGRGLGGSSAVNAMVALRGAPDLYRSWGWDDCDAAWQRVAVPAAVAADHEVGAVDRALRTHADAEAARLTRIEGRRVTAAEAYLWPAADRPNLSVQPGCSVDRIEFDGSTVRGVALSDGTTLEADRVVLCAGAIHSPAVLLRSGLANHNIGRNLQDHPSVVFTLQLVPDAHHPPSSLPVASVIHQRRGANLLQLLPMNHLGTAPETAGLGALLAALMTPKGNAGTITVDAMGAPVIDFALLADDEDVRGLQDAAELGLELLASEAFGDIVEQVFIDDQGTTVDALDSPRAIEQWVRGSCGDYVHATGTCAMGAVVDDRGAVDDTQGLYVVDASVFPSIPDANTHLPTLMLAERLAPRLR